MSASWACPRCRQPLESLGVGMGRGGGCRACGGVWLDDAAFAEVRQHEYARIAASPAPGASRDAAPDHSASIPCPECAAAMKRTRLGRVEVDVCVGHGTWFDRDELGRVARAIALAHDESGRATGREITPELEEQLARTIEPGAFTGPWDPSLASVLHAALQPPSSAGTLEEYLANRAQMPRSPRVLRCPNCSGSLPPEARGRWVCKFCNVTLEI